VFIQHCFKGIAANIGGTEGLTDNDVNQILSGGAGIQSNLWRRLGAASPNQLYTELTETNLDRHIHDYQDYGHDSAFISLSAGSVNRVSASSRNVVINGYEMALSFATRRFSQAGYVFKCWVPVGINPAPELAFLAEEVRNINTYVRYSDFYLEGEVTAKLVIPSQQIEYCEYWDPARNASDPVSVFVNPEFVSAAMAANIREAL
jgi:hypothetical protein